MEYANFYWTARAEYVWSNSHGTTSVHSKPPELTKPVRTSAASELDYRAKGGVDNSLACQACRDRAVRATTATAAEITKRAPSAVAQPL